MPSALARFLLPLTHRRSNGIPVPLPVARLIRSGDRSRGAGDWAKAELAYRAAVARMPGLRHVWIQAGHAGKEVGDLNAAADAYSHAAALDDADPEPCIHLGHVAKLAGHSAEAAQHYFEALRRRPDSLPAAAELMRTADVDTAAGRALIDQAIALVGMDDAPADDVAHGSPDRIYFDVTDLLAYFSHARLPTGIQRVQIELVVGALHAADPSTIGICCFSETWRGWRELGSDRFLRVAAASLTGDDRADPAWHREVISALLELVAKPKIAFPSGSALVNVGSSWSERNYFLHLRNARETGGPLYIPLVYDLIPMRHPEWFPAALVRDYRSWIGELFAHADAFFAISNATANDLRRINADLDPTRPAADVTVVALDGDFRSPLRDGGDATALDRWQLAPGGFVLMVSTIEPRKNHVGIFEAWRELLARMPAERVPTLVCVGGRGWMNEQAHALLAANPALRQKVRLLHGVGDADLALLYQTCLFTAYPSFYEGWGLPVTESLCYGKVPAISRSSSMPEAGGGFAVYFDPTDAGDIADVLQALIENPDDRMAKEAEIIANFRPRSWSAIAGQLLSDIAGLAAAGQAQPIVAPAARGRLSFSANATGKTLSGERFRHGSGWAPPGPDGAGVLDGGATLRLRDSRTVAGAAIKLRLTLRDGAPRRVIVRANDVVAADTMLHGGSSRWVELPDVPGTPLNIHISDLAFRAEQIGMGRAEAMLLVSEIAFDALRRPSDPQEDASRDRRRD